MLTPSLGNGAAGGGDARNAAREDREKLAYLGALCLFLSAVEYLIPKPLPFLRIGLANLPLMLALDIFSLRGFLVLVCIKVIGQALITGTLFSYVFLFSAGGTFCSALLMFGLMRVFKERISFIGIGTAGAMVSCGAQVSLAYFFIFKESVRYIAPVFLGAGLVTGSVLGLFCAKFKSNSLWFKIRGTGNREQGTEGVVGCLVSNKNDNLAKNSISDPRSPIPIIIFFIGFLFMLVILLIPSTVFRVIAFLVLWLLAVIFKKKTNPIMTVAFLASIIAFNLLIPYGRVLYSIGFIKITSGALTAGIHRAVTFQALVMLSKLTISNELKLPGKFGSLLAESLRIFSYMMNNKKNTINGLFA